MKNTNRTDPHRPGAIVPADYKYVLSYALPTTSGGWPIPAQGINCQLDRRIVDAKGVIIQEGQHDANGRCCVLGLIHVAKATFAGIGATGKCSVCGTCYSYGDVWYHTPSAEYIHIGHTCSDKYEMLADRSRFELERGRREAAAAREVSKVRNQEERQDFLTANPGLEEDLKVGHHIVQDIARKFQEYRSLSPAQVALVRKIANEVRNPPPAEAHVPAPKGRVTVRGKVVSTKTYDGHFGTTLKMTVKVTTPGGVWLCWGTVPDALLGDRPVNGATVEFTATLKPGRDAHFALFSRPTKASVVSYPDPECTRCRNAFPYGGGNQVVCDPCIGAEVARLTARVEAAV
jgi:hypothetical protein